MMSVCVMLPAGGWRAVGHHAAVGVGHGVWPDYRLHLLVGANAAAAWFRAVHGHRRLRPDEGLHREQEERQGGYGRRWQGRSHSDPSVLSSIDLCLRSLNMYRIFSLIVTAVTFAGCY